MQLLLAEKMHCTVATWMSVRLFATTPASLKVCGSHDETCPGEG
jgi:hypothetical protein